MQITISDKETFVIIIWNRVAIINNSLSYIFYLHLLADLLLVYSPIENLGAFLEGVDMEFIPALKKI